MKFLKFAIFFLIIFAGFCFTHSVFSATEFVSAILQTGGDYNTLSSWENAINTDLTVSSTKVYSVSTSTGAVSDGSTVSGSVSTTTKAKVKHYSSLNNQILIENIRKILTGTTTFDNTTSTVTGDGSLFTTELQINDYIWLETSQTWQQVASIQSDTQLTLAATSTISGIGFAGQKLRAGQSAFQSGEQLRIDASNYVAISDNGNDPIAIAKIDGAWTSADTTAVTIDGWTTSATNYIKVYTTAAARHSGVWNDTKYRINITTYYNGIYVLENYVRIEGLQLQTNQSNKYPIWLAGDGITGALMKVSHCIVKGTFSGAAVGAKGIYTSNYSATSHIYNNIIYDFINPGYTGFAGIYAFDGIDYIYNNTVYNSEIGYYSSANRPRYLKNNISYNNTDNYSGTFDASSTNNLSGNNQLDAPGINPRNLGAGETVTFANESGDDFHLASNDAGAKNYGTSSVSEIGFNDDIDGQTRSGTWDIGADEFVNFAPDTPININQYLSDCSTSLSTSTYWVSTTSLCFKGTISDSNTNDQIKLQMELSTSTFSNVFNYAASSFATSTATSSIVVSSLTENQYRWQARSLDFDSATSSFSQFNFGNLSFGIDLTPPSNVSLASISADSYYQLTISANIATDTLSGLHSLTYFFIETTGNPGASSSTDWQSSNIFVDSGLSPGTLYSYKVKAKDNVLNESGYSASFSFSTPVLPSSGSTYIKTNDYKPPVRYFGFPSAAVLSSVSKITFGLLTSEPAACFYIMKSPDLSLQETIFETTSYLFHSQPLFNLESGKIYSFSVFCEDEFKNRNAEDYLISFEIFGQFTNGKTASVSLADTASTSTAPIVQNLEPRNGKAEISGQTSFEPEKQTAARDIQDQINVLRQKLLFLLKQMLLIFQEELKRKMGLLLQ